jgi:flavin reductase (DIM6/NTAB) family NADH-FMN oxidoreductase RutF
MSGSQQEAVRAGFGRLAVAVAIITTLDGGRPHGCTGMAWAEHTDPPLLLTTLRLQGRTLDLVTRTGQFGVSVLSGDQETYVRQFAAAPRTAGQGNGPDGRFNGVAWSAGPCLHVPLLDGCAASFECEVESMYPFGAHKIVVGRVAAARAPGDLRALVHYGGRLWPLREAGQ